MKKLGTLEVLRADLGEEGSYDEAVAGCDYAFLLAAPVNYKSTNPEVCGPSARPRCWQLAHIFVVASSVMHV
jgi:hypothetical protein